MLPFSQSIRSPIPLATTRRHHLQKSSPQPPHPIPSTSTPQICHSSPPSPPHRHCCITPEKGACGSADVEKGSFGFLFRTVGLAAFGAFGSGFNTTKAALDLMAAL
nr:hypothetical protein [Tanacetum cinerariifolium]